MADKKKSESKVPVSGNPAKERMKALAAAKDKAAKAKE